jgi:aerobic-type carbon monoxide dehydrogenase small subunit (CoxS/CutS family)
MRGSGAAAAALAASGTAGELQAAQDGPKIVRGSTRIALRVNGKSVEVDAEPRTTLLEVLRRQLGLTGAKPVSLDGSSGASTVMVDGRPVSASTMLALQAADREIRTVESLGGEPIDEVPRAFVEYDAQQCGFCTPGFVVAVRAFLDKNPRASEAEIREGLGGNICRCGTYAGILQAVISQVQVKEAASNG